MPTHLKICAGKIKDHRVRKILKDLNRKGAMTSKKAKTVVVDWCWQKEKSSEENGRWYDCRISIRNG